MDPTGKEYAKFPAQKYRDYIGEHVEPWSYIKFPFLKPLGWKGFVDGPETSLFAVAPMARLNAADGMATPLAQKGYEDYFKTLGGKPVHHTLANHWARVVEMLYAAERMVELLNDPEITSTDIRTIPTQKPDGGHRRGRGAARHAVSTTTRPTRTASSRWPTSSWRPRTTRPASR